MCQPQAGSRWSDQEAQVNFKGWLCEWGAALGKQAHNPFLSPPPTPSPESSARTKRFRVYLGIFFSFGVFRAQMRPYPIHGWPVPPFLLPPRDKAVGGCAGQPGNGEENEPTQGGSPLPPLRTAPSPRPSPLLIKPSAGGGALQRKVGRQESCSGTRVVQGSWSVQSVRPT